jgi:hypothetical protein
MLLAPWLTNKRHQKRSANILTWFVHTHSVSYLRRIVLILYSDISRSSEFTTEKLSRIIQRLGTRCYSSKTDDSHTYKTVLSLPSNPVKFSPYHIMNQLMYLHSYHRHYEILSSYTSASAASWERERESERESDGTASNHQTLGRVVDKHASFLRGSGLTFRARKPQPGHPNFLNIL